MNLYCGRFVFFLFFLLFSDVAFHVTNDYFPPTTGPGLPPLQRLLLLQATGNACGTSCFIPSARRRYCGCSAVSRGSEEPESCFLRRNAAGIFCHFRKATFILAYFNNAAFRESENARLAHFPDAKEWAAVPSVKCMLGKAAAHIGSGKGSAGASASAHLAVVSRWDLMGEKTLDNWILITETSSILILLRQQHIRQDGTVVQPSHHHPTPTQSHHLQVLLQSLTSDLPAGAPKRGEGCRWRHHLDIYVICLFVFVFFKGCSLSTESFTISLTGPPLHFKLKPWKKKDI